jgi:hypothetical protein
MSSRVDIVLTKLPAQFEAIKGEYERSLTRREISDDLLHDVARFVEDCQRVLDWTATDIDRKHGRAAARSPYFPLHGTPGAFAVAMQRDFPQVPDVVYRAIERHQPYQPEKAPLGHLHDLARVNKHQDFTPQTRTETRRIRASNQFGSVEWSPNSVRFGRGVSIGGVPVDPATQRPVPSQGQTVTETIYVGWNFSSLNLPVLPTLDSLGKLTTEAVTEVRQAAAL